MLATKQEAAAVSGEKPHFAFFRDSGWIMIATVIGGMMMWGLHFLSRSIPQSEYAVFGALMAVIMCVPALPLQMTLAQQAAHSLAIGEHGRLVSTIRASLFGTFVLWLAVGVLVFIFRNEIAVQCKVQNQAAIWMTLVVVLTAFWWPMFMGMLQGKQDFFSLGWCMILAGVGRLGSALLIVLVLRGEATGLVTAAFLGYTISMLLAVWQTRDLWTGKGTGFSWRPYLRQVLPMMLGFGACQFMFTADTVFVNAYFDEKQAAPYVAAGTLARALLWLVLPLAAVMFPKIVHSSAKAEKTDLLKIVLMGTGLLAAAGGLGLVIMGRWAVGIVYPPEYVAPTVAMLPWYAAAIIPLALGNVLINDLLARGRYGLVTALVPLAVGYGFALSRFHASPIMIIQVLAVSTTLLFLICAWFTFHGSKSDARNQRPAGLNP